MAGTFLFLESFYGGSHKSFADGLAASSGHQIHLEVLPARHWKWRMRASALWFYDKIMPCSEYDGLIVTDLISLSDLKMLLGRNCPPVMLYFHENQLAYPLMPGEKRDFQFAFTDLTSAVAADMIRFNSRFHMETFFETYSGFLSRMPDFKPLWILDEIRKKSDVLYPGCSFPEVIRPEPEKTDKSGPPLIIWNHRWEHDKNPDDFFRAISAVREAGIDFELALLGEKFNKIPEAFAAGISEFSQNIVHAGYAESKDDYFNWLKRGDIIISTAFQENFGISVVEAVFCGCIPLLPDRLSYPELIPEACHDHFIYKNQNDLVRKLKNTLINTLAFKKRLNPLYEKAEKFSWDHMITSYDDQLEKLAAGRC